MDSQTDLPDTVVKYAETAIFTSETVPAKLTSEHSTKAGVWGRLTVFSGELDYIVIGPPRITTSVGAGHHMIIVPTVLHLVKLKQGTSFQVEFLK